MIAEEEELKKRVLKSIESCRKELSILYSELQMPPFEVFTFEKCVWVVFFFFLYIYNQQDDLC